VSVQTVNMDHLSLIPVYHGDRVGNIVIFLKISKISNFFDIFDIYIQCVPKKVTPK